MGTVARAVYTGDAGELVTISRAAALDVVCPSTPCGVPEVGVHLRPAVTGVLCLGRHDREPCRCGCSI